MNTKSTKIVFTGCSFTAGTGWTDGTNIKTGPRSDPKQCADLWVNICHHNIDQFRELQLFNVSVAGASNRDIFEQAIGAITDFGDEIDTLFCQWTGMPRYTWNVGFELWDTCESINLRPLRPTHDVNLNRGDHWPRAYINDVCDRFRVLHHLHWEILAVVKYTSIIQRLSRRIGIHNVFFVNGLCPWDRNYFVCLHNVLPEAYTEFTKKEILNIESRDDQDIYKLYHLAHDHYREAGPINPDDWINLYDSFLDHQVDCNHDHVHPGKKSNWLYFDIVKKATQKTCNF
jgi:hypothetical protein